MTHQAIVYDPLTGKILYVLDPENDMPPEQVISLVRLRDGEGVALREKQAQNRLHEWQAHVSHLTGKLPADAHPEVKEAAHAHAAKMGRTLVET